MKRFKLLVVSCTLGISLIVSTSVFAKNNTNIYRLARDPIILIGSSNQSSVNSFINNINVLGGIGALSDNTVNQITEEINTSKEPSKIVIKNTDSPPISTGVGDEPSNELWLTYSDGTEELLVSSHSAQDAKDIVAGIYNPQFSLDKKKIYFMSEAWTTSSSIHIVDIETKSEHFVCAGNYLKLIQSGPYAGNLIVNQHRYHVEGGSYNSYYIVSPEGEQIMNLGDSTQVLSQFE